MTVDLTTFNGMTSATASTRRRPAGRPTISRPISAAKRTTCPAATPTEVNLWKQEPAEGRAVARADLGWTRRLDGGVPPTGDHVLHPTAQSDPGILEPAFWQSAATSPPGDPQYPFPWLNWSYRPFNNEYELLLVPTVSSSKLLARNTTDPRRYFGYVDGAVRADQYGWQLSGSARLRRLDQRPGSVSASLEFLRVGRNRARRALTAQLHRLFAYVGVPSRFANAQLQMRADLAGATEHVRITSIRLSI